MSNDIDISSEPLPGYRLIERIGSGGYGEVWRVEAPGGLTKAIKFVFGKHHEKRATNEMRSLDHVRGVRHPFLLSLERIEVVAGRLLVVTELADGSVKDRFDQCRRDGLRGIPRDELLNYLRDTADALDFMSSAHSLQHLDIKPENLLLLAGHVKVADFGLVKDVRQSQASLVGGMTPLYAAPEVFRGAPSCHSDQYSLAIVYQEMLTGTLPFAGNSAAELTLHHLNDEPDLAALAAADRYSVSRALSKDANHRYPNCRGFVDSLASTASGSAYREASQSETTNSPEAPYPSATEVDPEVRETKQADFFEEDQPAGWGVGTTQMLVDLPPSDCELVDLPPVDISGCDLRWTPTLVLGIGGSAGQVLSHFHKMLSDKWGSTRDVPAIQFLHIDTDPQGLVSVAGHDASGFSSEEVLTLPLHRPQHYRENSQQLLHWLGRRWLYNIPRSLRTEGLRPLGRLALADHARTVGQRIRRALVQALAPASLATSSSTTGCEFRQNAVRVFVVASIAGGTGSGMSLDMGYAVRAILQKMGLAELELIGVMLHSTGRDAKHSELARVNAYSWLSEFNHFRQSDNPYPGDISCGLPGHAAGVPAFDHTYLVHLGESLEASEFDQATHGVAEYLRFNTFSPARVFFDSCRAAAKEGKGADSAVGQLRAFGIHRPSVAPPSFNDEMVDLVCEQVMVTWRTGPAGGSLQKARSEDQQSIKRLQLDSAGVTANIRALLELEMNAAAANARPLKPAAHDITISGAGLLASIDQIFDGCESVSGDRECEARKNGIAAKIIAPLLEKLRTEVRRMIARRIDDPAYRLAGARQTLIFLEEHFRRLQSELRPVRDAVSAELNRVRAEAAKFATKSKVDGALQNASESLAQKYRQLRLDELAVEAADYAISMLEADRKASSDEIAALNREIDLVAAARRSAAQSRANGAPIQTSESDKAESIKPDAKLKNGLEALALRIDARLQQDFLNGNGGLARIIIQGGRLRAQLNAKLHEFARTAVSEILAGAGTNGREDQTAGLDGALATATPMLLEYGGRRRALAVTPDDAADDHVEQMISQRLGSTVNTISDRDSQLTICVEADNLSLPHVALEFVERRRDRIEFAGRVHSRTDIAWLPLVSTNTAANASIVWATDEARATVEQHAMSKTLVM
ncbi:MAG TPA: tubulin-like doman-containing protein [Lacipirellulaceae bacterium]|nr:tubulin-like doman-containing protein [Lacipirellulaceae bacterium]